MSKLSNIRIGNITSSEIVDLTTNGIKEGSFGAPFYSYVEACKMERFFKMPVENDREVLAFSWGKLCELVVHNKLGLEYEMQSELTLRHPKYSEWLGSPDGQKKKNGKTEIVTDIKCPLTRKGVYNLIKHLYNFDGVNVTKKEKVNGDDIIQKIRKDSKEGEKYYWQLVSNACILDCEYAELIVFIPYYEELADIKLYNQSLDEPYWLVERCKDEELPFIYKESGIENINIIRFKVPQEDKDFLTSRVLSAIALINE